MNNKIPAVEKTITLMELLARYPGGMAQSGLKRELGISMSTTYRILQTLLKHHWVRKNPDATYTLDHGLLPLLYPFRHRMQILDQTEPVLKQIADRYDIAAKLSIRRGGEQVTLLRAEPAGPVALTGQSGSSFPLIEGSVGAALLCDESEADIEELIAECRTDLAERRHPELLFSAIAEVRNRGYVFNLRKNRWNIAAVSMPVRDERGSVIAALTLIGTESDFSGSSREKLLAVLAQAVRQCGGCP